MTNKEAIKILPDMKGAGDDWDKAIDIAIEALKREISNDDISRQAAIEGLTGYIDDTGIFNQDQWFVHGIKTAITHLKMLPSVQPDIIHCKDCKYWMPYDWMFSEVWQSKNMDDYPEDEIGCQYCDMNMGANDFCSRSERRAE